MPLSAERQSAQGPKFDYKLRWFDRLTSYAQTLLESGAPAVLAGDFNVMPTDLDVYAPERWVDDALFRPEVREAYRRLVAQGWTDALRVLHPDERLQRAALAAIVGGEAGGTPALIRQNLVGDFRGVEFKPIEVHIEGLKRSAAVPDILAFEIEGVASRNRSGDPLYIDNTAHPANRRLALARSKETHVKGFGLDLDLVGKGNNGHYAPFAWAA